MGISDDRNITPGPEATTWRLLKWIVVLVAVGLSMLAFAVIGDGKIKGAPSASLPSGAESAAVADALSRFPQAGGAPAVVVFTPRSASTLSPADLRNLQPTLAAIGNESADGAALKLVPAQDRSAAIAIVPFADGLTDSQIADSIKELRADLRRSTPNGVQSLVTGGPAYNADLSAVFDGANVTLLLTTAGVVALLLLLTYRSPWLWLVPLSVVGVADQVAARLVNLVSSVTGFIIDDATIGITSVLVFGAGTNYALLLIARYREELREVDDRHFAMKLALRQAGPAVLASSSTVILALLSLSFAVTPSNRVLGYAGAIGIATAVVYALVVLPAALLLFPRGLFWPFVPRLGQADPSRTGIWARVGRSVTARPVVVTTLSIAFVAICAVGLVGVKAGLSQNEQFRVKPEAVVGQEVLAASFAGGFSEPTVIISKNADAAAVLETARSVPGVQSVEQGASFDGTTELDAVLTADPESAASRSTITALRQTLGARAQIGGPDAEALDDRTAADRDARVIIPVILGIVLLVLFVLLRSFVAPFVLLATVVATYVASMGASWVAFTRLFDFPALDLGVPLLAFLFLVALGVDYNIFLTLRAREEAHRADAKTAITTALAVTGGVITSAGILLASVFTVLGVLPLITLTQLGIIVGFGVLLDTLVVRSLLVPALVTLIGDRFWWPSHPSAAAPADHEVLARSADLDSRIR